MVWINAWTDSGIWRFGTGNEPLYVKNSNFSVNVFNTSPGGLAQVPGYIAWGSPNNLGTYMTFKRTSNYGLIKRGNTGLKWSKVQLWEVNLGTGFKGMPKRKGNTGSGDTTYAAFFSGQYIPKDKIPHYGNYPIFYRYPTSNTAGYFEILTYTEMQQFPIVQYTGPNPGSPDDAADRGDTGDTTPPTDDVIPPVTGPGSGTGTTIGTSPFPDFSGLIPDLSGFTPPPATKPPGPNKPGGKWVTGPDGKRYYLPPGLDFSGFKKPPPPPPKPETKIVVRMPKGYAPPFSTAGTKPRMTQRQLDLTDSGQAIGTVTDTFIFPYIPQNIRYSDIGSNWQEVPRAMNTSFVDWAGYKLMKVSMDFLVSAQYIPSIKDKDGKVIAQGTAVSDGLMNSVTNELNMLRRMATNKFPVTLEGFDDILQIQMARSRFEQPRGLQFVIQDLNITAGRRTIDETTGLATTPSLISAAQVSITLQEIPVETVTIVKLPPLELGSPVVGKGGSGGGGSFANLGLQSELLTGLKWEIP